MWVSGHGTSDANFKYYEIPFKYTFCSEVLAPQCIEKISSMVSLMLVAMVIYVHESHGNMFDRSYSNKILVRQTMHGARTPKQYIIWIALVPF